MYKEKIIDTITGEETWRDYTSEEIAQVEKAQAEAEAKAQAEAETRTKRQALLDRLGITEEEARLLLG
jgi:acyl-CoA reductase-like NAD-dependent aldehyde dehydrogenase